MKNPSFIQEIPKRPKSEVFAYEHRIDPMEFRHMKDAPGYMEHLKRRMARSLADHIVEVCQLFEPPDVWDVERGLPIRMECTINDRGRYENWLPLERDEGRKEGRKRAIESLPYGIEPGLYYE